MCLVYTLWKCHAFNNMILASIIKVTLTAAQTIYSERIWVLLSYNWLSLWVLLLYFLFKLYTWPNFRHLFRNMSMCCNDRQLNLNVCSFKQLDYVCLNMVLCFVKLLMVMSTFWEPAFCHFRIWLNDNQDWVSEEIQEQSYAIDMHICTNILDECHLAWYFAYVWSSDFIIFQNIFNIFTEHLE